MGWRRQIYFLHALEGLRLHFEKASSLAEERAVNCKGSQLLPASFAALNRCDPARAKVLPAHK